MYHHKVLKQFKFERNWKKNGVKLVALPIYSTANTGLRYFRHHAKPKGQELKAQSKLYFDKVLNMSVPFVSVLRDECERVSMSRLNEDMVLKYMRRIYEFEYLDKEVAEFMKKWDDDPENEFLETKADYRFESFTPEEKLRWKMDKKEFL